VRFQAYVEPGVHAAHALTETVRTAEPEILSPVTLTNWWSTETEAFPLEELALPTKKPEGAWSAREPNVPWLEETLRTNDAPAPAPMVGFVSEAVSVGVAALAGAMVSRTSPSVVATTHVARRPCVARWVNNGSSFS